jgi:chromosome partitioning protein
LSFHGALLYTRPNGESGARFLLTLKQPKSFAQRPYVIVVGNEKGGSGKSSAAMQIIIGLARDGYRVGAIDLDARQATLSAYVAARAQFVKRTGVPLPIPRCIAVTRSDLDSKVEADSDEGSRLDSAMAVLSRDCQIVVIDCPGSDAHLSDHAHALADTLITPINDSFVDFSMLATLDPDSHKILAPSLYSEMVWKARKKRFAHDRGRIDWLVMRNRLVANQTRNTRQVGATLEALSRRIGFRVVKGFGERVIFRELYLQGLTLMDVREAKVGIQLGVSHIAARAEIRSLINAIRLPPLAEQRREMQSAA